MPIEFKPSSVPLTLSGAVDKFQQILQERPLGICLQGTSIQELEKRIEEFKDVSICWGAMNRFDIYQNYILNKINKKLQITLDVGEVKFVEDYERKIRIPRWKTYLLNPESLIITSEEILENIQTLCNWDILSEYSSQIMIIEKCRNIHVPNSIMLYLIILAKLQVKKVILFGFDGFGNPKAFKDTPIWDATEFEPQKYCNKTLTAYYKPETTLEERLVGYQDEKASDLHSNCPTLNDQYHKIMNLFCKENNVIEPEIVNCSINALYTVFRKISYDQLHGELT
jgi:hypothetical protein